MRALAVVLALIAVTPAHAQGDDCGLEAPAGVTAPPERASTVPGTVARGVRRIGAAGALTGKTVYVSAGHGWVYDPGLGRWRTQRGNTHGLVEDLVAAETIAQHLIPILHDMGAYVVPVREASMQAELAITDDADPGFGLDGPAAGETIAEGWSRPPAPIVDQSNPFDGGGSLLVPTDPDGATTATWTLEVPAPGDYDVFVAWVQGPDRASDAHYVIHHAGGESHHRVDQRRHGSTWVLLGRYHFAGEGAIALVNDGDGAVVSADAARIGGGLGRIDRGGGASGRPAYEEGARYAAQWNGAPPEVYDYADADGQDDVGTRSRFAAWDHEDGEDAVYVAWHTNAPSPARGTSSFAYGPEPFGDLSQFTGVPGSLELMDAIHTQLVTDLRAGWDPDWQDRGQHTAYFGEVNPAHNPEMPATLIEVAFHDTLEDADALREPRFRALAAGAIALGIARYFAARDGAPAPAPLPARPVAWVRGGAVAWSPVDGATGYRVYLSRDGRGFDDGVDVDGTELALPDEDGPWFARVTARNSTGESRPSAVAGGLGDAPQVLLIDDFARLDSGQALREDLSPYDLGTIDRIVEDRMNDRRTIGRHGLALAAAGYSFESAPPAQLDDAHAAVVWTAGETPAPEVALDGYLDAGGALVVTASEAGGLAVLDRIGAAPLADDAGATTATGVGPFDGLAIDFGDAGPGGYDADEADALTGPAAAVYPDGAAAAVYGERVVVLGFPVETVGDPELRAELYRRALAAAGVEPDVVEEPGGCGCASGGEPSGLLLLGLLFILPGPWRPSSSSRSRSSARSRRSRASISAATRRR